MGEMQLILAKIEAIRRLNGVYAPLKLGCVLWACEFHMGVNTLQLTYPPVIIGAMQKLKEIARKKWKSDLPWGPGNWPRPGKSSKERKNQRKKGGYIA